ncbi:MAG: hypothetical protein WDO18_18000 [Acidobacteriota bacterium]
MKRTAAALAFLALTSPAWAQQNRDAYRVPYKAWRDAADIEKDALSPPADFAARAQNAARAAQTYFNSRADFLAGQAQSPEQERWAATKFVRPETLLDTRPEVQRLFTVAGDYLTKTIGTFSGVKDPAIQQVRQSMERERAALNALNESINTRRAALKPLTDTGDDAELLRTAVSQNLTASSAGRTRLAEQVRREAILWSTYYNDLVEGATAATVPVTAAPNGGASSTTSAAPAKPVPVARPSMAGQFPMARYLGDWVFPSRGLFYGPQPESVDLTVTENNGRLTGSLTARFARTLGSTADPILRLTFDGPVQQGRSQTLPVMTESGVAGTIELIPGAAFNLLEVTFETTNSGNKITGANFVLLRR